MRYYYSSGQNKVYVVFSFYSHSTIRIVPFCLYGFFCSYVKMIADSVITGFECNE